MGNSYADQMALSKLHGWYVYVISVPGFSKIGTAANVGYRLSSLQNGNPHPLQLAAVWHFGCRNEARAVERTALASIFDRLPQRDWCRCSPFFTIAAVEQAIRHHKSTATRVTA